MKPFLLRLCLFAALQLVVAGFVLWRGNPRDENHYYLAMLDKIERMEQTSEPRLLFVGGSNVAFGLNCEAINGTGHVPINLGLHAGLGLEFCLRIVENHVRQGDIIVLIPEYELLSDAPSLGKQRDFVRICPTLARYFHASADEAPTFKYQLDHQALATAHAWVNRAFKKRDSEDQGIYVRTSFNSHGDIVAHWNLPSKGEIAATPIAFDPKRVRETIQRLNAFAEHCRNQGAEVYYSFPPMPKERFAKAESTIAQFRELLDQELLVTQIDQPADRLYENDQFFDTNYHLSGKAATNRTERLIESLENCRRAKDSIHQRTATADEAERKRG